MAKKHIRNDEHLYPLGSWKCYYTTMRMATALNSEILNAGKDLEQL